jgi:branched-chain amino acid transport system substrate-binding protein
LRQRLVRAIGGVAVAVLVAGGVAACKADQGGGTTARECGFKIAFQGPLTGDAAGLGIHMRNGAKLAVEQYNKQNPDCTVTLEENDSQGDPAKAPPLAQKAAADTKVLGVIGPAFSGETESSAPIFEAASLPMVTPSATRPSLSEKGWKVFHRAVGNDTSQGPAAGRYIKNTLRSSKVYVVDDQSAYGAGLADEVKKVLGTAVLGSDKVAVKQTDFAATVTKIRSSGADVLFYGGYYQEAGLLLKQLRGVGSTARMVAGDGVNDAQFINVAGQAVAEGTILTCPCAPADRAKGTFLGDYKALHNNAEPGVYADVSYDVANIFLEGIKAGNTTRDKMLQWVKSYNKAGVSGATYKFTSTGELDPSQVIVWAFTVKGGKVVPEAETPKS